jgi:hypothetical protein
MSEPVVKIEIDDGPMFATTVDSVTLFRFNFFPMWIC